MSAAMAFGPLTERMPPGVPVKGFAVFNVLPPSDDAGLKYSLVVSDGAGEQATIRLYQAAQLPPTPSEQPAPAPTPEPAPPPGQPAPAASPTSGVLHATVELERGEAVFENLPGGRLKFTFDHDAWQATIRRQPNGTQTLVMRSLKPGTQTKCDVRWEIVQ